jgi:hypothetical protein
MKNFNAKYVIEEYLKKNMKNLMVYVDGVEERQHNKDFLHRLDFLIPFRNEFGEGKKAKEIFK